jgi:hypothetical protein
MLKETLDIFHSCVFIDVNSHSKQRSKVNLRKKKNRQKNITLRLKKFMIIVDHDRINNVPMIKSQEG